MNNNNTNKNKEEEYRQQAAEAKAMAERTASARNREAWLRIAQGWMSLIRRRPQEQAAQGNTAAENAVQQSSSDAVRNRKS